MNWDTAADARAEHHLAENAAELYAEAERVAARTKSASVSPAYVDEAAFTIRIRRPNSAWPDILLAIGVCLIGLAGGVLAVVLTTPPDVHLTLSWVGPVAVGGACLGFLASGIGGALKLRAA